MRWNGSCLTVIAPSKTLATIVRTVLALSLTKNISHCYPATRSVRSTLATHWFLHCFPSVSNAALQSGQFH
ncbi:hypothetical protein PF008_g25950 [Phytophthora fragariae]|nr:hypothetical protein PF008_g25950 [Phytophthora fragariae]